MLTWFDAHDAQQFGLSLAEFFIQRIPLEGSGNTNKSKKKQQEVLNKMLLQVQIFKTKHKLNIYKKAKLGNALKWRLLDAGYNPVFVDELTKELLRKL